MMVSGSVMHWSALLLVAALLATLRVAQAEDKPANDARCYELRVYFANDGKLDALNKRFREHTCQLFEKHGMTNVGYWMPLENPERKLYYILSYPNRAARDQ